MGARMYEFKSRVRYSEVGADGALTLNSVVNYFQDCTIFHSESVGLGMEHFDKHHQAWLLSAWQVVVEEYPKLGTDLTIATWSYGSKGFYGYRNFLMRGRQDEIYAYASSTWIFIDTLTGRPIRLTDEQMAGYPTEEPYPMDYAKRKIILPETLEFREAISIQPHQIDTNQHVNNNEYIKMALESLDTSRKVREMRAEYKQAAVLGDNIYIGTGNREEWSVVSLCNEEKKPYANVEFLYK